MTLAKAFSYRAVLLCELHPDGKWIAVDNALTAMSGPRHARNAKQPCRKAAAPTTDADVCCIQLIKRIMRQRAASKPNDFVKRGVPKQPMDPVCIGAFGVAGFRWYRFDFDP